ncbi:MAG: hypothetical protein AAF555_05275 [Verrucomicrobiota bacterium]
MDATKILLILSFPLLIAAMGISFYNRNQAKEDRLADERAREREIDAERRGSFKEEDFGLLGTGRESQVDSAPPEVAVSGTPSLAPAAGPERRAFLEELEAMREELEATKGELSLMEEERQILDGEFQRQRALQAEVARPGSRLPSFARVTDSDAEWNFVIIDAGTNSGVSRGMTFRIRREGSVVGDLLVREVEPDQAVGELVQGSLQGEFPRPGDEIIVANAG